MHITNSVFREEATHLWLFGNKIPRRVPAFRYYIDRLVNSPTSSAEQIFPSVLDTKYFNCRVKQSTNDENQV